YVRSDPVGSVGEFSSRGGILDFYSPSGSLGDDGRAINPVRVESFGDQIDSIREFDPETQRSIREVEETMITPMRDGGAGDVDFRQWANLARDRGGDGRYERALRARTAFADEGEDFRGGESLMPLARPLNASVFDYLRDTTLVVDEPAEVEKQIRSTLEELWRGYERAEAVDELALEPDKLFLTPDELRDRIGKLHRVELRLLGSAALAFEEELATEDVNAGVKLETGPDSGLHSESDPKLSAFINREPSAPLFLFPPEPRTTEVEIQ